MGFVGGLVAHRRVDEGGGERGGEMGVIGGGRCGEICVDGRELRHCAGGTRWAERGRLVHGTRRGERGRSRQAAEAGQETTTVASAAGAGLAAGTGRRRDWR